MMSSQKEFELWKKQALSKLDKSSIRKIDKRILNLCNLINKRNDMFTLSSCSGRICLLNRKNFKKEKNIWLFVSHDLVNLEEIKNIILKNENENKNIIEFRQESAILHICVNSFETARKLMSYAKESGFNQVGIIGFKKKIVIEIICDSLISVPIYDKKLLVSFNYLEYLTKIANKFQKISWKTINKLEKKIIKFEEN